MKKSSKLFIFAIALFFGLTSLVSAKTMTLEKLGKEVQKIGTEAGYSADEVYVIGEYVFTNNHTLTTQDFMMAATTLNRVPAGHEYTIGPKSNAKDDSEYQKMNVYAFEFDEDGVLTPIANLLGDGKNEFENFEVKYIDYNYIAEDAKYEVEIAKTYTDYQFAGNGDDLTIDPETGIVTGLIKSGSSLKEGVFSGEELTGYYLAYDLKITGYNPATTIKITGLHEKKFTDSSFSSNDKSVVDDVTTIHFLQSLNPEKDKTRKIVIEVDLDGAGTVYGPTEHVIDWSKADIQTTSTATIDNNIPTDDVKDNEDRFGYFRTERDTYALNDDGTEMTGNVFKQTLTKESFGAGKSTGYFITLNVKPKYVTDDIDITYTINDNEYHAHKADLTEDSLTLILKLDETKPTREIKIKIDSDGTGKEVYLPSEEYTIDLSQLVYAVDSEDEVKNTVGSLLENKFYTPSYDKGVITIDMDVTEFTKASDVTGTGIIKGIKDALKTGNYEKITLAYEDSVDITPDDLDHDTGVSDKFNQVINAMIADGIYNLDDNEFTIEFTPKTNLTDVSAYKKYTVHFNVTINSEKEIANYLQDLNKQNIFDIVYKDGTLTVALNSTVTSFEDVEGTNVIANLIDIINSGRYSTIVFNNGKNYVVKDEATAVSETLALFNAMAPGKTLAELNTQEFKVVLNPMVVDDTSVYKEYKVVFTLVDVDKTNDENLTIAANKLNDAVTAEGNDYGFKSVKYDDATNKATFTIDNPDALAANFANSGIIDLFKEYAKGATQVEFEGDTIPLTGEEDDVAIYALAGKVLKKMLGEEISGGDITIGMLAGKSAEAEFTFVVDGIKQTITYKLEFAYTKEELIADKDALITENVVAAKEADKDGWFTEISYDPDQKIAEFKVDSAHTGDKFIEFAGIDSFINMFADMTTNATAIKYSISDFDSGNDQTFDMEDAFSAVGLVIERLTGEGNASDATLSQVINKTVTIKVTYKVGTLEETVTYTLNFTGEE